MAIGITMAGSLIVLISLLAMRAQVHGDTKVPITILESAIPKGAVCLDGSAPAYSYAAGSGKGANSWIVYLQGGGWCYLFSECVGRAHLDLGSTRKITKSNTTTFSAILDSDCTLNPDFCNWHRVYIHYCDGSSYMSDIMDSKSNLYFRGGRIFKVMMEEMLAKGMLKAKQAILSGSSAGGLATMLHCDQFRELFPIDSRIKCISDSGFFLRAKGIRGDKFREEYFAKVIKLHDFAKSLPHACTSKRNLDLCLFPEYFAEDIQTPLFIIESAYDKYQLGFIGNTTNCTKNLNSCNSSEVEIIKDFGKGFKRTLSGLKNSSTRGMFVHSCYIHDNYASGSEWWTCTKLSNKGIIQAVGDWYFDRSSFREIDTKHHFPQNCSNSICPELLKKKSRASLPSSHSKLNCLIFLFLSLLIVVYQM